MFDLLYGTPRPRKRHNPSKLPILIIKDDSSLTADSSPRPNELTPFPSIKNHNLSEMTEEEGVETCIRVPKRRPEWEDDIAGRAYRSYNSEMDCDSRAFSYNPRQTRCPTSPARAPFIHESIENMMPNLERRPSTSPQAKRHGKKRRPAKNKRMKAQATIEKEVSTSELVLQKALENQHLAQEAVIQLRNALENALNLEAHACQMVLVAKKQLNLEAASQSVPAPILPESAPAN